MAMEKFSLKLASSILGLEIQKEKLLSDEHKKLRLCFCRSKILKTYVNICQLFHIRLISKIIKFKEDLNVERTVSSSDLRQWYNIEMYDKLLNRTCVNNKMILLMRLLQDKTDSDFFEKYTNEFENLIKSYQGDDIQFLAHLKEFFFIINDWMENHILGILSCKIDCSNIDDKILMDYQSLLKNSECHLQLPVCDTPDECSSCPRFDKKGCGGCPSRDHYHDGEDLHIYLTEENLEDNHVCNFIDTVYMYHTKPLNIDLKFDYVMFDDPMKFDIDMMYRFQKLMTRFKSIKILNAENVDFGECADIIEPYIERATQ